MEIKGIKSEEVKLDYVLMKKYECFHYLTDWTFKNIY